MEPQLCTRTIPGEELKSFSAPAECKADFPQRLITAYWSAFNVVDQVLDIVRPVAFNQTIADRFPRDLIKGFFDHEVPIGMPKSLVPDSKGLLAVIKVLDGAEYDKYLQMVVEKVAAHASFAYDVVLSGFIANDDPNATPIRELLALRLWEGGPVIFPANEQAVVLGAKSAKELKELVYGARAHVAPLLAKQGTLTDRELATMAEDMPILSAAKALQKQLKSLEIRMLAAETRLSVKALSEQEPEPTAQPVVNEPAQPAATTLPAEPPPQLTGVVDPEDGAYLQGVAEQLVALEAACAAVAIGAPVT